MPPPAAAQDIEVLLALMERTEDPALRDLLFEDLYWRVQECDNETRELALIRAGVIRGLPGYAQRDLDIAKIGVARGVAKPEAHVVIVTVKEPELDAVKLAFGVELDADPDFTKHGARFWHVELDARYHSEKLRVVITKAGFDENYQMAAFCNTVFNSYEVGLCILVGMAGGVEGRVAVGDVVEAVQVLDYVHGVYREDGVQIQPLPFSPQRDVARKMTYFNPVRAGWYPEFEKLVEKVYELDADAGLGVLPARESIRLRPDYKRGVILAGDQLLEDGSLPDLAARFHSKTLAADMEGAGFCAGCEEAEIDWMVFRGVADLGKHPREKDWQLVSTLAAATAVRKLLEQSFVFEEHEPDF